MIFPFADVCIIGASIYWLEVHKEYSRWANDRAEKNLPYISYKEYAGAQGRFNSFVLSKDRPWKLRNYLAWALQKVFKV